MKKVLMTCLVLLSVLVSSTAFSAIPEGKFPVRISSSRETPNNFERELIRAVEFAFKNSTRYRVTNNDENLISIKVLVEEYQSGVVSSDWLASATPIRVFTIVWLAKPKNEHAYYLWHDIGRLEYPGTIQYILEQADTMVWTIKNQCPYVFEN